MKNRKNHNRREPDPTPGSIEKGREALKKLEDKGNRTHMYLLEGGGR